jgi:hypothetical protein
VEDPVAACDELRETYGLGSERSGYLAYAGARSWLVPLPPPSYLELLSVEDEEAAQRSAVGRQLLDRRKDGGGLVAWSVLVEDLTRVSERLGIPIFDYTKVDDHGVMRGWRSVSGPSRRCTSSQATRVLSRHGSPPPRAKSSCGDSGPAFRISRYAGTGTSDICATRM